MAKYHIKRDGSPGECHALFKCPLGNRALHFKTIEEAQDFADIINEAGGTDKVRAVIYAGKIAGVDYKKYAKPEYNWKQMAQYLDALIEGVDTTLLDTPGLRDYHMRAIKEFKHDYSEDIDCSCFANPNLDEETVTEMMDEIVRFKRDPKYFSDSRLNSRQVEMIIIGLRAKLDVTKYNNPELDHEKMKLLGEDLERGLPVELYNNPKFSINQMYTIRNLIKNGYDVTSINNPDYSETKMYAIIRLQENGKDPSVLINNNTYNDDQIIKIRDAIIKGHDYKVYENDKLTWEQMEEISKGQNSGVDVGIYAKDEFNSGQMIEIRQGLEQSVDVSVYAKPEYSDFRMRAIRDGLEKGLDSSIYNDDRYNDYQVNALKNALDSKGFIEELRNPELGFTEMEEITDAASQGFDASWYANNNYDINQMHHIRECQELGVPDEKLKGKTLEELKEIREEAMNNYMRENNFNNWPDAHLSLYDLRRKRRENHGNSI